MFRVITFLVSTFLPFGVTCHSQEKPVLKTTAELDYDLDYRMWYDKNGTFSAVAKFDGFRGEDTVRLRRKDNDKVIEVNIEILSPNDQELLERIRRDIELNAISKAQRNILRQFHLGFEKLVAARKRFGEEVEKIKNNESLLAAVRKRKLNDALNSYQQSLDGTKVNWHVVLDDVVSGSKQSATLRVHHLISDPFELRQSTSTLR